jgi:hypothetical protein
LASNAKPDIHGRRMTRENGQMGAFEDLRSFARLRNLEELCFGRECVRKLPAFIVKGFWQQCDVLLR